MKYLIMLEGTCEKALIETLINNGDLIIRQDDMLDEQPHVARNWKKTFEVLIKQLPHSEKVKIIRIGDTLKDKLKIPSKFKKKRISSIGNYCTKPEFEFLLLIEEELVDDYYKSSFKDPKSYARSNISFNGKKYDVSPRWLKSYFSVHNPKEIIHEYRRIKKHKKGEKYLSELITKV